jgi:hypothetical protein
MGNRRIKNLTEILKHPSTSLILGDTGEGKTVVGAAELEWFNEQGTYVYMMDKVKGYPKWVHNLSSNKVEMKEPNSVLFIDDAHNYFYAGLEEDTDALKALDLINRARRHGGKRSVVYNTQMSNALSRKLIGMTTYLIFKKSSPVQIEFERPEFQKMFETTNEALKDQPIEVGYVISTHYTGLVKVDMPKWYTEEISEAGEHFQGESKHEGNSIFKGITDSISMLGKAFG